MEFSYFVLFALLAFAVEGRLLSNFFHDNMVLQYDNPHLFGWTLDPNSTQPKSVQVLITVTNSKSGRVTKGSATSDAKTGFWTATLPAYTPASGESLNDQHKVVVSATGFDSDGLSGVLFGNVFLCGGQSNMASIAVRHAENNKAELELAGNGVLLTPCVSHSNQRMLYQQDSGQIVVSGRCLAYHPEEAARDTLRSIYVEDCVDAASAKDAGQYFSIGDADGHIFDADGNCLTAYVEGWSWERCGYAEPNVELSTSCGTNSYNQWQYDKSTNWITNNANHLCLTAINDDDTRRDSPLENFRIFRAEFDYTNESLKELRNIATQWTKPTTTTLAKFSAVCWYMGRNLYENQPLKGMPIGLVESAVSGSYIEAWMSDDALNKCPCHEGPLGGGNTPSVLWNAMIAPMQWAAFAGMSWYQAESNIDEPDCYKCMFPAMISDWRAKFPQLPSKQPMPFAYVEITPRSTDQDWSGGDLRLAQQAALALSYVGCAPTQDLGDAESPFNTEHPRVKKPIGHRLALQLRKFVFGESVPDAFPDIKSITLAADKRSAAIIFVEASFGGDFSLRSNIYCPVDTKFCNENAFEVMAEDQKWYPAKVTRLPSTQGFGIVLTPDSTFPSTGGILKIRYLYAAWPLPVVYSNSGIPLSPFLYDASK